MTERRAAFTLIAIFILTIVFGYFASKARVDYEFEKFFPASSNEVDFFEDFRDRFGTDNDFLVLGIVEENGVMDTAFLKEIKHLIADFKKLNYVNDVLGGSSLKRISREPLSGNLIPKRLLRISNDAYLQRDAEKVLNDPMLTPVFFSRDGKNISLIIKHKERLSKKGCDSLVVSVKETLSHYNFQEYHLAGRSVAQSYYVNLMTRELIKFSSIGAFLVVIFLFLTYRNF